MLADKYSSPSALMKDISGTDEVGVCGIGTKSCYDVVLPARSPEKVQLFQELPSSHPDYHEDLARLAREMNAAFREKAGGLLTKFAAKHPKIPGEVHMAVIGSPDGLYLAYATRLPADEMLRRGANLAKNRIGAFLDELMTPPPTSPSKTKKA